MKLTSDSKVTSRKVRLKSAKNLCLGYRFFDEIRQNPPILLCFQAKFTDSLQKSGAPDKFGPLGASNGRASTRRASQIGASGAFARKTRT